jgi:pimeloyl-ACP methyl ester carboxylesterase
MRRLILLALLALPTVLLAQEWKAVLQKSLESEYSQTRYNGLKQVDTDTVEGLKTLWGVLADPNPDKLDWYVRQGAYEALMRAKSDEALAEIERLLAEKGNPLAKEAVIQSVVHQVRKAFLIHYGGNDDRQIEEAKKILRKSVGDEYYAKVLPILDEIDPDRKKLHWIQTALDDESPRVRFAALRAILFYPSDDSVALLLGKLEKSEKTQKKSYDEWVMNRFALETLTGKNYGNSVEDWKKWKETAGEESTVVERVKKEEGKEEDDSEHTSVAKGKGGIEVMLIFKVVGEGYPLLVLPWRGYDPEYFRPYFHGIEEVCKVYYVTMPEIEDFKGLKRESTSNLIQYPTQALAEALIDVMKQSGLEQFGVLGHGPAASTLAMVVAAEEPEMVSHLVLMNPTSAGDKYGQVLEGIKREGRRRNSREIVKGIEHIQFTEAGKPSYEPADADEAGGLNRALDNLQYCDATSPEVGWLQELYSLPGGTQVMNDDSWSVHKIFEKKPRKAPTMVIMGQKCLWSPEGEMTAVATALKAQVVKFPNSSSVPFIFETYKFTETIKAFFKNAKPKKKKGKEDAG